PRPAPPARRHRSTSPSSPHPVGTAILDIGPPPRRDRHQPPPPTPPWRGPRGPMSHLETSVRGDRRRALSDQLLLTRVGKCGVESYARCWFLVSCRRCWSVRSRWRCL